MEKRKASIKELLAVTEYREGRFDRATLDEKERTIEVSFSSEEPVARWYGKEILSHEREAVNLERFESGTANALINHDPGDWFGVIKSARVANDKKGRAVIRFGNSARAQEIFRDVKDGILTSTSVGYMRNEMQLTRTTDEGEDEFTVTRWTPFEVSLVTVPADHKVGVGRAVDVTQQVPAVSAIAKERIMENPVDTRAAATLTAEQQAAAAALGEKRPSALELEQARKNGIINLCKANKIDDRIRDHWIVTGVSLDAVAEDMLRIMEERGRTNPQSVTQLGLTPKETRQFSLMKAVQAVADKNWTNAGFELECHREIAKKLNVVPDPNKFFVPLEIQRRAIPAEVVAANLMANLMGRRDLTVATAGAGGFLVGTDNQGFIELLRNRSVIMNMGARRLSGLVGNVTIPRQSAAATAIWLANEASTITESQQTFVQLALAPKTVGAYTEVSRQLLLQSDPSAEGIVMSDLSAVTALAVDAAGLSGTGASGQPTGITNTAGIGAVTGTSLAYAGIIEFQTDLAAANIDLNGYVTTPAVAGLLKQRVKFTNTASPLWDGRLSDAIVDGYRGMSSNQMAAASMIGGDWTQLILAEWGVLEIEVNPFANFQAAIIGIRAIYTVDVGVRYPAAFSLATTIT